jgi:hypothetical protein
MNSVPHWSHSPRFVTAGRPSGGADPGGSSLREPGERGRERRWARGRWARLVPRERPVVDVVRFVPAVRLQSNSPPASMAECSSRPRRRAPSNFRPIASRSPTISTPIDGRRRGATVSASGMSEALRTCTDDFKDAGVWTRNERRPPKRAPARHVRYLRRRRQRYRLGRVF